MKKFAVVLVGAMLAGSMSFAAETENAASKTVDTSKNPITGTQTTTVVEEQKVEGAAVDAKAKVTTKTKKYKNGKQKTTVEADVKEEKK